MRLLFLNYECPPAGGGAGFAMLALARQLVAFGHHVDILTARVGMALEFESLDGVRLRKVRAFRRNVHEAGMPGALSYVASAAMVLPGLLRSERYDACHYYFGMPTGLLSLLPGVSRRVPYLVSLRGSDVPGYDPGLDKWHRLAGSLTRRVWRGASAVVANSDGLRALALRFDPECRIEVILNGVDTQPARAFDKPPGPLRVVTVSRLIARKGIDTLIHALAHAGGAAIELAVVGEGPRRAALEALARDLGVAERVRFLGFLPQSQVRTEVAAADVFALASHSESCSMALLQAMGSGIPVVVSRVGGNPELVAEGVNGLLFTAGDAAGLSEALQRLREAALRERLGRTNAELAIQRHAWSVVAHRYEALLRDAVDSFPSRGER